MRRILITKANSPRRGLEQFKTLVLIAAIIFLGCTTSGKNLPASAGRATIGTGNIQEITVQVESFFFKPSRVEVFVNIPVRLTLKSGAFIIPHNFSLHAPEAGIDFDIDIGHGDTKVIEFTPTRTGEYPFHCDKGSHAEKGMTGTLVVIPQM